MVVVFCEGEGSEPDYVHGLRLMPAIRNGTSVTLRVDKTHGDPLQLVEAALERRRGDSEIDACWCLFDVEYPEPHPRLGEAVALARTNDINLAISNPCFELWLTLHYEDRTAHLSTAAAVRGSRAHDGRPGKRIDASRYLPHRHDAAQRARLLAVRHERDETVLPHNNPSSTMYAFLQAVDPEAAPPAGAL